MKVLVTGGAGYIGHHLTNQLHLMGASVRVLDLQNHVDWPGELDMIAGSILDEAVLDIAMQDVEIVYHLAAYPHLWAKQKSIFEDVNHLGTRAVLKAAQKHCVKRVVHCSTEAILIAKQPLPTAGDISTSTEITEDIRLCEQDMLGPYCVSKYRAEQAVFQAIRDGMDAVIVNPTAPLGPGDYAPTPPMAMLRDFLSGKTPAYMETTLNFVDVRDVALGHILAAEKGISGQRYILGGYNLKLSDFLQMLEQMSGRKMPSLAVAPQLALGVAHVQEWLANTLTRKPPEASLTGVRLGIHARPLSIEKAKTELGFTPRLLQETIKDAIAFLSARAGSAQSLPAAQAAYR